ncbi:ATP-binding protein [Pseudomonas putida]|uniref:ATP-binding protein n=1 Tax=Pseudomonas putida TaxID=303 RepID=UPI000B3C0F04|nr:ATP-binding protein [Pseudomonas putida]OUS82040.1 hypothetical protein CBP05_13380 [Pseudomonas putida]OUS87990.1 hypothetical protein CBP06_11415 [Pseudomonas putida]
MSPSIDSAKDLIVQRLAEIRANLALVGSFEPKAIVDLQQKPEITRDLLRGLARICDEVPSEKGIRWQLTPDSRRATLRELSDLKRLRKLARRSKAEPGDTLGAYLIKIASGKAFNIEAVSTYDLSYLYTAQQFLEHLPEGRILSTHVNRVFALREFKASLDIALPTGLFGREDELTRLHNYLLGGQNSDDVDEAGPLYLTGLGGTGKSALLAAYARRLLNEKVPVVWFDFDRAAFSQADTNLMTLEFSRQLGLFLPSLMEPLARFREQAREVVGQHYSSESYESSAYSTSSVWSIWHQEMAGHLPILEPIGLVLDTFEEMLLRGANEHRRLRNWLKSVQEEGALLGLRPIISGRVLPSDLKHQEWKFQHIALDDLSPESAYAMLHQLLLAAGIDAKEDLCRGMIEQWGSSPLFIRLLARFLSEKSAVQEAAELLVSGQFNGVPHALVRGFTYQRILNRLRTDDPDLRTLAHMGLILRRVNAKLINEVLAEPCKLPVFDSERADQLFKTLARQVWLVEETERSEVVRHRRDLRQVMLGLMESENLAVAQGIHLRAHVYYTVDADPYLTKAEQDLEADYHRLFISEMDLGLFALLSNPSRLVASLGEELEYVPLQRRAWLKRQVKYELNEEELNSLSTDGRVDYQSEQISQTLKSGGTTIPATDYGQLTGDLELRPEPLASDLPSFIALNFSTANLRIINRKRHNVVDDFFQMIAVGRTSKAYAVDFCETPIWRVALAALYTGESGELYTVIRDRISATQFIEWQRPIRDDQSIGLDVATAVRMLATLCGNKELHLHGYKRAQRTRQRTHSNDELKALLISLQRDSESYLGYPAPIATGLLCDLTPDFIRCVEGELSEFKVHDPNLSHLLTDIRGGGEPKLANFQRKVSSVGYVELHRRSMGRSGFKETFRPLYPELYPHIRGAIRGADFALLTFVREAESYVPVWPLELKRESFERSLKLDSDRWTATLIHFADRCGLLYPLLNHIAHLTQNNIAVVEARRLYEVYDQAVMGSESFEANRRGRWFEY